MERTVQEINFEIEAIKKELQDVHGTTTEVYARIVGYYRSVRNWNKGKRDEYNQRKMFTADYKESEERDKTPLSHYEIFIRKTCPNCPPVKDYVSKISLIGTVVDTDTDAGLERAKDMGVLSTPTVIFYDNLNKEIKRCHSVEEIMEIA